MEVKFWKMEHFHFLLLVLLLALNYENKDCHTDFSLHFFVIFSTPVFIVAKLQPELTGS